MYDFSTLSATDFELFVSDLLSIELSDAFGEVLSSYAPGPDGGVDLRAVHPTTGAVSIVQCKHRPRLSTTALSRVLRAEALERTRATTDGGPLQVDSYLLATSASVTPAGESKAIEALRPLPVPRNGIWARGKLNTALAKHEGIERRHFKLWLSSTVALTSVIGSAVENRSSWLVDRMRTRLPTYADTPAYEASLAMLTSQHVVVITGDPGVGKSTVAHLLLLTCASQGWEIVDVSLDINEAWKLLRGAPKVFFYDDFLGQTDAVEMNKNEANRIQELISRVRAGEGGHRLVLTTRDQVLAQARASADDRVRRITVDQHRSRVRLHSLSRSQVTGQPLEWAGPEVAFVN